MRYGYATSIGSLVTGRGRLTGVGHHIGDGDSRLGINDLPSAWRNGPKSVILQRSSSTSTFVS